MLRRHHRDLDRAARLAASVIDQAPGAHPFDEIALAKQLGQIDRLERLALDERLPFPARREAAKALADRGPKVPAGHALRPQPLTQARSKGELQVCVPTEQPPQADTHRLGGRPPRESQSA